MRFPRHSKRKRFSPRMWQEVGPLGLIALARAGALAAQAATGRIEGLVVTPDGLPAGEVRVVAELPDRDLRRETETDVHGTFRLSGLSVGTYRVRLALVGYRPVRFDSVTVSLGRTTSLGRATLTSQALELGEIVVVAARPLIDVVSAATTTNFTADQFTQLPTERNFRSIVKLAPQANASYYPGDEADVAGDTGPGNAYFLDGVNITDPRLGATSSNLPYNFIRELELKTGGYEAEFGRATGGIVNVVTHSGTNHFGGQVFGFYSGSGLTAEPRFAGAGASELAYSEYDVGGSLGGPIVPDRLWFFAAYNPSFRRQRVDVRGPELPHDSRIQHLFATKLTWQAGPLTDVVLTVHGDPSRRHDLRPAEEADSVIDAGSGSRLVTEGGYVLSSLVRRRIGRWAQAELGATWFSRNFNVGADLPGSEAVPRYVDGTTNTISGGIGGTSRDHAERTALRGSLLASLGRHTVKAGVEYEDNYLDEWNDRWGTEEAPRGVIFRVDEASWIWSRGYGGGQFHNRIPTTYLQDSWRVTDRVTLNAGLRWDSQYLSNGEGVVHEFTGEWQPRVGLIVQPGRPGTQKVFASFGRFYEQILMDFLTGYSIDSGALTEVQFDHDPRADTSNGDTLRSFTCCDPDRVFDRDLDGQYFDEVTLGYERAVGRDLRAGLRGVYRTYRSVVEDAPDPVTGELRIGNPGRGLLAAVPEPRHTYAALVFTFEKPEGRFTFLGSYVLSSTRGNYEGLYSFVQQTPFPNEGYVFDEPSSYPSSTGPLPNDHRHVAKLSGSYGFDFGLTVGTALAWMSGHPLSEYGQNPPVFYFVRQRGTAGQTPAVFDAAVQLAYAPRAWRQGAVRPTVYLDLFQIGNRRTGIHYNELHYLGVDDSGAPTDPNPIYGRPELFQPPMSARLGLSLDFGALD